MIPLYRVDGFVRVDDGYAILGTPWVTEDLLHGQCDLFAILLAQATGLRVGAIVQPEPLDDGPAFLVHAFCVLPGDVKNPLVIDGNGFKTLDDVYAEYGESPDMSEYFCGDVFEMKQLIEEVLGCTLETNSPEVDALSKHALAIWHIGSHPTEPQI